MKNSTPNITNSIQEAHRYFANAKETIAKSPIEYSLGKSSSASIVNEPEIKYQTIFKNHRAKRKIAGKKKRLMQTD